MTRRKVITKAVIGLVLLAAVWAVLLISTDLFFRPPQNTDSVSQPGEWAMFRHDPTHTGVSGQSDSKPEGVVKWVFSTDAPIHSSPAVADGTVYFGSRDRRLIALDAATGAECWEFTAGGWIESSPAISDGRVYFGTNDGSLHALDARDGSEIWTFRAQFGIRSSPAVADGVVYFGADDYHVYGVDAETGAQRWDFETDGYVTSSPVVADGIVYVGSRDSRLYALDARNGRRRLRFNSYDDVVSSPVARDGIVYSVNNRGSLCAVEGNARNRPLEKVLRPLWIQLWAFGLPLPRPPLQSGLLWRIQLEDTAQSSPVLTDDSLYLGVGTRLVAVDVRSREIRWEFQTAGPVSSSPAISGAVAYVGSEDGRLYAVDAVTGEKLWDIRTGAKITSSPAVADGTVYIGSHDGNLYAVE